jgi:hypothetical protein
MLVPTGSEVVDELPASVVADEPVAPFPVEDEWCDKATLRTAIVTASTTASVAMAINSPRRCLAGVEMDMYEAVG